MGGCLAWLERVEQAAWASSMRLVLLLRTDVNGPPNRFMHHDILVVDVSRFTARARKHRFCHTRVVLHIYRLEWVIERVVCEGDVADAGVIIAWDHASNCHTYSKRDGAVAHNDIL